MNSIRSFFRPRSISQASTTSQAPRIYTETELGILENALQKRIHQIKSEINLTQKKLNASKTNTLLLLKHINRLWFDFERVNHQLLEITTQRNRLLVAKKFQRTF